ELGEVLVHGYDIATATGRPWPLAADDARLALRAALRLASAYRLPHPGRAGGAAACPVRTRPAVGADRQRPATHVGPAAMAGTGLQAAVPRPLTGTYRPTHLAPPATNPQLLIRREIQAHPLPAHTPGELVRCCSAMRSRWRRCAPLCGQNAASAG